jgi:ATP-dependent RNA helicase RhlE
MTEVTFKDLGLGPDLLRALEAEGYTHPTPIQAQAIPSLLDGRDLLGIAQTGTGKTAAFVLPILQTLAKVPTKAKARKPQALILAPTRELAIQIGEGVATYGQNLHLRHAVIFGGVGQNPQVQKLVRGVHVLVATPGRLLDLIGQGHIELDNISFFVLDEADRMLDMGFIRDVRKVAALLPEKRQSLLFSATMPSDIAKLAASLLHEPERVEISPKVITVDKIEQSVYFRETGEKLALLAEIMGDESLYRVIVFTRTKHRANKVSEYLKKRSIPAEAIHGNKSQTARQRALETFKSGDTRVLVATDIAARGIDIDDVTHVINFELPNEPESYVHRIGRTARAGADGIAFSFCAPEERPYLRDIERLIKRTITDVGERPFMAHIPKKPKATQSQGRGGRGGGRQGQGQGQRGKQSQGSPDGTNASAGKRDGQARSGQDRSGQSRPKRAGPPRSRRNRSRAA